MECRFMVSNNKRRSNTMVIRSLDFPIYNRPKKGLAGEGLQFKGAKKRVPQERTFEDFLIESFQGEVVQNGSWFSTKLSDRMKKNIKRI